jgi:hypothetical protein
MNTIEIKEHVDRLFRANRKEEIAEIPIVGELRKRFPPRVLPGLGPGLCRSTMRPGVAGIPANLPSFYCA